MTIPTRVPKKKIVTHQRNTRVRRVLCLRKTAKDSVDAQAEGQERGGARRCLPEALGVVAKIQRSWALSGFDAITTSTHPNILVGTRLSDE